jgi:hypothetical protein
VLPCGVALWWGLSVLATGETGWLRDHWPKDWDPAASYGRGDWTWVFGALVTVVPVVLVPFLALGCVRVGASRAWPVLLAVVLVLGVHAVIWALGAYGSAGYPRYFVTLAPAFALLIAGGIEIVAGFLPRVPAQAWTLATAGVAVWLLVQHPTATVRPPMPPDGKLFAALGAWITRQDPDPVLHSAHPFAYLEVPSVPAERFDDFGWIRAETLADAEPGTYVLVEDRLYGRTRRWSSADSRWDANPTAAELSALGFSRVRVPDLGASPGVADPRHDPAIATMDWALYRKRGR